MVFIMINIRCLVLLLLPFSCLSRSHVAHITYCKSRVRPHCCPGKDDSCSVEVETGVCYCDAACYQRGATGNCCPDYSSYCENSEDSINKHGCSYRGSTYKLGAYIYQDCHKFTCRRVGNTSYKFSDCKERACLLEQEVIDAINAGDYTWKASNYSFLWGLHVEEGFKKKLGILPSPGMSMRPVTPVEVTETLPESFDARIKWPNLIQPVRDQGYCGASWAFSTVGVISDRYGIQNRSASLSPQHLISCNTNKRRGCKGESCNQQKGCKGGALDRAWNYIRTEGISEESCYPYESGKTGTNYECEIRDSGITNSRGKKTHVTCPDGRVEPLHHITPVSRINKNESVIMDEIYKRGPVLAMLQVQQDFFYYKSGVYQTTDVIKHAPEGTNVTGWHSLRVLGWGVDRTRENKPIKYWLCANSWGDKWGENGYVRILRGTNHLFIEDFMFVLSPGSR